MLDAMDRDIAAIYQSRGVAQVRPRFVGPLLVLSQRGELAVKDLAAARGLTHSAMSQTVAAMVKAGLVNVEPGSDARSRIVRLTDNGADVVPLLRAEWRATERVVRELDAEVEHPLMTAVHDVISALEARSFRDRLVDAVDAEMRTGDPE
jgi:DNA-binding MarR family transcriptional regulator